MRLEHDLLFTAKLLGRRRERKVGDRFLIVLFMPSMIPSLTLGAGIFVSLLTLINQIFHLHKYTSVGIHIKIWY